MNSNHPESPASGSTSPTARLASFVFNLPSLLVLIVIASLLFIPFLGNVHLFDWDEINFAEAAREMLVTGNYTRVQINFQPFWEKPPLFLWMQAAAMHLFGVNEFAARFPNAICGILMLCLLFFLGKKYFSKTFAWLWVLAYVGSFLPHFYFKSGIIDPWFNLFIFSGIVFLIRASEENSATLKNFLFAGAAIGLGMLTKGPVALLIPLLAASVFYLLRNRNRVSLKSISAFFASAIAVAALWFIADYFQNGSFFITEFIRYQIGLFTTGVAGHSGPFYYHLPILLVGCFPASVFALSGFLNNYDANEKQQHFKLWMVLLFFVTLVLFSIVKTKIIHYSSLCYFPLTFLAAWEIHHRIRLGLHFSNLQLGLFSLIGILLGMVATALPYFAANPEFILPYIKDVFAKANLEAQVDWNISFILFGFAYWLLVLAGVFWLCKGRTLRGSLTAFFSSTLLLQVALFFFVPRIERYSQGAAIDFYKTLKEKDVYVEVLGFKSYAHLFYTAKQPQANPESMNKEWLLTGAIDKPAYFVCKITKAETYKTQYPLTEIARKNGFVFLKREPSGAFRQPDSQSE